ncbi:MAG: DUF5320 domain-containing protein [Candidatus Eremiobacteraeota bacterium]|nr:DUF5320 domain-containing protein [Candidatus Eremiobacteraeota bacterium]
MPAFDGTGPMGQGQRTGWGMGYCPPGAPVYARPPQYSEGLGRGRGGFGRGSGYGRGYGRGRGRGRAQGWAPPFPGGTPYPYDYGLAPEGEIATLKDQSGLLQRELERINERINELQSKEKTS